MVQPLTLLQQMKMVAQQFLGLVPTGSYYDFNGVLYKVGGMDPTTGKIILNPVTSGSTTLMDPIPQLYPHAVPGGSGTAAGAGGSAGVGSASSGLNVVQATGQSGGASLSSILPIVGTIAPSTLPAILNKVKGSGGAGTQSGANVQNIFATNPSGAAGSTAAAMPSVDAAQKALNDLQSQLNSATSQLNDLKALASSPTLDFNIDLKSKLDALGSIQGLQKQLNDLQGLINGAPNIKVGPLSELEQLQAQIADTAKGLRSQMQPGLLDATSSGSIDASVAKDAVSQYQTFYDNLGKATSNVAALTQQVAVAQGNLSMAQAQVALSTEAKSAAWDAFAISDKAPTAFSQLDAPWKQQFVSSTFKDMIKDGTLDSKASLADPNVFDKVISESTDRLASQFSTLSPDTAKQIIYNAAPDGRFDGLNPKDIDLNDPANRKLLGDAIRDDPSLVVNPDSKKFINLENKAYKDALRSQEIQFGTELVFAGVAAYGEESALQSLFKKGFSFKSFMGVVAAGAGLYTTLHLIHKLFFAADGKTLSGLYNIIKDLHFLGFNFGHIFAPFLKFISSGLGFLALQGALVLLAWLLGKKPPPEQVAAETLNDEVNPVVWNPNGQVIPLLAVAGLTMATLGLNLSPSAPMMQTMTLSQAAATNMLLAAGASQVPTDGTRYADVFVEQGGIGQPTRVVYLTPAGVDKNGKPIETLTVQTLNKNFQFAQSQPPTGFIPFFIPGPGGKVIANPQVVQNLSNQQHLLLCADGAWVTDASLCAAAAGAASHSSGGH